MSNTEGKNSPKNRRRISLPFGLMRRNVNAGSLTRKQGSEQNVPNTSPQGNNSSFVGAVTMRAHRHLSVSLALAILSSFSTLGPLQAGDHGKRMALLIGVNRYDNRNLSNLEYAEADVQSLNGALQFNYQVELLLGSSDG